MASYSASDLVSALTGESPGFRESQLPTSKDIFNEIYKPDVDNELLERLISPVKDELLQRALINKAVIGGRNSGYV
jgi:hypothetical protein